MPRLAPAARPSDAEPPGARAWAWRALLVLTALAVVLALLLVFFPWDWLRGPVNRHVSERIGRHFAITGHLDVRLGRVTTVVLQGVEVANPPWARDPWLLRAQRARFQVRLWPLWHGRLVLPQVALEQPELGLQILPDGRRTWSLDRRQQAGRQEPQIGELRIDRGQVRYVATDQRIDLQAEVALAEGADATLPLSFAARGQWRGQPFVARGRAGGVLRLSQAPREAFPLEIDARVGRTRLQASGRITHLAEMAGLDMRFELEGQTLSQLHPLLGVTLPDSPPYRLAGQAHKQGQLWRLEALQGRLGRSDVQGALSWDRRPARPLLAGALRSRELDLADLGPMIGLPPPRRVAAAGTPPRRAPREGRVLPGKTLDFSRLHALDADLAYAADRIRNAPRWPLESLQARVRLQDGQLRLEPLVLGVAGGRLAGSLGIDARLQPAALQLQMEARGLALGRLLPAVQTSRSSLGAVSGRVQLQGRGQSVARLLGSSSGQWHLLLGAGRISNILLEFMGLDGGEIVKFLVRGDQNIRLRCGALAFDVTQGRMDSRVILLDTVDTVVRGRGRIDLARETLDLYFEPEPKDASIFSLRSPLRITGTLGTPEVGPDKAALAGRAGLAIALATLNPLLALAATVETGPGQDAACAKVLQQAAQPRAATAPAPGR